MWRGQAAKFALDVIGVGILCWAVPNQMIRDATLRAKTVFHRLSAEIARRPRTVLILIWIVALVPMIHLTSLVRHYGVNVPMLDDWEMAPLIVKAQTGELAWADLFQQQQEARTILPKLIFVFSAARGEWCCAVA